MREGGEGRGKSYRRLARRRRGGGIKPASRKEGLVRKRRGETKGKAVRVRV